MKLSIIIVNYQSRAYLERCLASVFAKNEANPKLDVVVVNNGTKEDLAGLEVAFPGVRLIQNLDNRGFGNANNLGAQKAQGDLLLFLNPDTEIIGANLSVVVDAFRTDSDLGILGLRLIDGSGKGQDWSIGGNVSLWSVVKNNLGIIDDKKYWKSKERCAVFWVAGTAMFVRKTLFEKLLGFDENFFLYFEDVDLCQRASLLGKKVVYFPEVSVLHHGGKSFSDKKKQKKAYYLSQDYYFKKHRGFFEATLLRIFRFFSF